MIVRVELGSSDLHASAKGNGRAAFCLGRVELELAEGHAGGEEVLRLAIIFAAIEVSGVRFQFRPNVLADFVLGGRVPNDGTAKFVGVAGGQIAAERRDDVESAEALTAEQRWHYGRVGAAVAVAAGGDGCDELGTKHVVAVFFIAGKEAVLVEEADIPEAIFAGLGIVLDVGRIVGIEFAVEAGNEVEAPACSVVPGSRENWSDLTSEVGAEDLDEHGIRGDQGHGPSRLLGLGFGGSRLPALKNIVLRFEGSCCGEKEDETYG